MPNNNPEMWYRQHELPPLVEVLPINESVFIGSLDPYVLFGFLGCERQAELPIECYAPIGPAPEGYFAEPLEVSLRADPPALAWEPIGSGDNLLLYVPRFIYPENEMVGDYLDEDTHTSLPPYRIERSLELRRTVELRTFLE
jgi:hypothetical protein